MGVRPRFPWPRCRQEGGCVRIFETAKSRRGTADARDQIEHATTPTYCELTQWVRPVGPPVNIRCERAGERKVSRSELFHQISALHSASTGSASAPAPDRDQATSASNSDSSGMRSASLSLCGPPFSQPSGSGGRGEPGQAHSGDHEFDLNPLICISGDITAVDALIVRAVSSEPDGDASSRRGEGQ